MTKVAIWFCIKEMSFITIDLYEIATKESKLSQLFSEQYCETGRSSLPVEMGVVALPKFLVLEL